MGLGPASGIVRVNRLNFESLALMKLTYLSKEAQNEKTTSIGLFTV